MQPDIKTIYIPDLVPNLSLHSIFYEKLSHDKNFVVFHWNFNSQVIDNYKIDIYKQQLVDFLNKFENQLIKVIVDGFSAFLYQTIEHNITAKVTYLYIINPFDHRLFLKTFDIKQKFLPNTITLTIYKYIHLFSSLDNFRENEAWLKGIKEESTYFSQLNILHHKIFDQILSYRQTKNYHKWIESLKNVKFVVGEHNPFFQLNRLICDKKQLIVIKKAGFCVHWENADQLYLAVKD